MNLDFINNFKRNVAVITPDGTEYKYEDLLGFSGEISKFLKPRTLIFCLVDNSIGSLAFFISCLKNNVVPLLLDSNLDREFLNNLLNTYKPTYLLYPKHQSPINKTGRVILNFLNYQLTELTSNESYELHKDLCLLLTTSGSTGSPKLVKLTYENLYSNSKSISDYLSINQNERPVVSLPMQYSFGLSIINSHLIKGATILLNNYSLMEKNFWLFMRKYEATSLSGIPYSFEILKKLRFFKMDLPFLKTITQAGGKLNDGLNHEFSKFCKEKNKRFFVMYGQTEASPRMSYLPHEYSLSKIGSIGVSVPGGKLSLIDHEGKTIYKSNVEGELVYQGKNVSMGYAINGADLSKDDENKGVLYTGDIAKRDNDSFYYIVGRKNRFIKLFGNRVNLDEIERILKNITQNCACLGKDDEMIIYITDQNLEEKIKSYISKKIAINPRAFKIKYISEIPKNVAGKTIYSKLSFNNEY